MLWRVFFFFSKTGRQDSTLFAGFVNVTNISQIICSDYIILQTVISLALDL